MANIEKRLTAKEREFCSSFLSTGDAFLSALRAGYGEKAREVSERLMCKKEIIAEIERLSAQRENAFADMASLGYRRLAFGNISDAVSLLYMENPSPKDLSRMDLFLVSEIKRPKDGSMEIKFFDRLKALEKLDSSRNGEDDGAKSLFDAISMSAKAVDDVSGKD